MEASLANSDLFDNSSKKISKEFKYSFAGYNPNVLVPNLYIPTISVEDAPDNL
jgi:hypothetical protein